MTQSLSVVIPAFGDRGHLEDMVAALNAQQPTIVEIVVSHSGSGLPEASSFDSDIPIRVLHSDEPLTSGAARNRGAEIATGIWIAFLDDDVMPAPDWANQVASALKQDDGNTCFVGSIDYDVSGGYWGLCLWFTEFGSVHKYMPSRSIEGGASANMFMHRNLYARVGGFPQQPSQCVDVEFMARCRQKAAKTRFFTKAVAAHRNISGMRHCLAHAKSLGAGSARVRKIAPLQAGIFAKYPLTIPLLFPARLALMLYRVARWARGHRLLFCAHLPGIALALLAWTIGFSKFGLGADDAN